MCMICVDFQRDKMTSFEARRALGEMREKIGPEHTKEVEELLKKADEQGRDGSVKDPDPTS